MDRVAVVHQSGVSVIQASAVRVRIPFRRPFATAQGTWHARDSWIIRLRDASGREGVGEASLDPAADSDTVDRLAAALRAAIPALGADGGLTPWLQTNDGDADPIALTLRAAITGAALDLGLVDLGGSVGSQAPDVPAHDAPARDVAVNATIATQDPATTVEEARDAVAAGFTCLKLKGGAEYSTGELVERMAAVRAAVGSTVELRLDVNGAWDLATARERLAALVDLGLAYVEQPIPPGDPREMVRLRAASSVPLAADESVASRSAAKSLLGAGAADVLVVKPARVGGPIEALAIARDAAAVGVAVTVSTLLETGVGLAAALRVAATMPGDAALAHGLATGDLLADDLLVEPLAIFGGRMAIPDGPGLGIHLDEAALERWVIERVGGSR